MLKKGGSRDACGSGVHAGPSGGSAIGNNVPNGKEQAAEHEQRYRRRKRAKAIDSTGLRFLQRRGADMFTRQRALWVGFAAGGLRSIGATVGAPRASRLLSGAGRLDEHALSHGLRRIFA